MVVRRIYTSARRAKIESESILSQVLTLRRDDVLKPEGATAVMRILTNKKAWRILGLSDYLKSTSII